MCTGIKGQGIGRVLFRVEVKGEEMGRWVGEGKGREGEKREKNRNKGIREVRREK